MKYYSQFILLATFATEHCRDICLHIDLRLEFQFLSLGYPWCHAANWVEKFDGGLDFCRCVEFSSVDNIFDFSVSDFCSQYLVLSNLTIHCLL